MTYAIFDEDPIPGFKASVKKWQANGKGDRLENEAAKEDERQEARRITCSASGMLASRTA